MRELAPAFFFIKKHHATADFIMQNAKSKSGSFREGAVAKRLRENADCGLRNARIFRDMLLVVSRCQSFLSWHNCNFLLLATQIPQAVCEHPYALLREFVPFGYDRKEKTPRRVVLKLCAKFIQGYAARGKFLPFVPLLA